MKKALLIPILLIIQLTAICSSGFDFWFTEGVMRVDFVLAGNSKETKVYLSKIVREPLWGGSVTNLIDTFAYGDYTVEIRDATTNEIIYSRGFGTLFREWQTVPEALVTEKAFPNTVRLPYPRNKIILELLHRKKDHALISIYHLEIDPADKQIEQIPPGRYKSADLIYNGSADKKVDIVILPEGYTRREMRKFRQDARSLMDHFFSVEPFKTNRHKFNVRLVLANSLDSGSDIPGEDIWKETLLNSNFYTFGIERYLTSADQWKICDIAAQVPYDQIIILANTDKYGGGGIFNFYSITGSRHTASPGVLVHEFGHAFAGLADEYYTSDVSYEGFYNLDYEPWEPNITTLKNFKSKWEDMLEPGIPVPTPLLDKYLNSIGVFEGAGYVAKGIYRSQPDCIMKTNATNDFCSVCKRAIERMINYYTE